MSRGGQGRHLPAFILLFLAQEKAHGLMLVNQMKAQMPQMNVDGPAVYRALAELEKQGAVCGQWDTQQSGAAKKCYSITDAGRELLSIFAEEIAIRKSHLEYFLSTFSELDRKGE